MKRVVLCRPEGPRNVGAALRASLNFGPCELHLVAPKRPSILRHPDFEQMSHGAEEARAAIVAAKRARPGGRSTYRAEPLPREEEMR